MRKSQYRVSGSDVLQCPLVCLTCSDVEPVGVIWCQLLEGSRLDDVDPGGHFDLSGSLQVVGVSLDESIGGAVLDVRH